jgi:hypothetical protein
MALLLKAKDHYTRYLMHDPDNCRTYGLPNFQGFCAWHVAAGQHEEARKSIRTALM